MTFDQAIQAIRTAASIMGETNLALTIEEATDAIERAHSDLSEDFMETSRRLGMAMDRLVKPNTPSWIDDE